MFRVITVFEDNHAELAFEFPDLGFAIAKALALADDVGKVAAVDDHGRLAKVEVHGDKMEVRIYVSPGGLVGRKPAPWLRSR